MTATSDATETPCVFCAAPDQAEPSPLLLYRGRLCFVVLNKFPYSNGHLMVVPLRHVGSLAETTEDELSELIGLTRLAEIALTEAYAPQGSQRRDESGSARRCWRSRALARPRRAPLDRRHQLHDRDGRHAGCARGSRRVRAASPTDVRKDRVVGSVCD